MAALLLSLPHLNLKAIKVAIWVLSRVNQHQRKRTLMTRTSVSQLDGGGGHTAMTLYLSYKKLVSPLSLNVTLPSPI